MSVINFTCIKVNQPILGKCDKCNNAIEGTITKANGKQFHLTCFTCKHCEVVLSSKYYATPENDLYCKVCHEEIMLPTCCKCNEKILAVADESSAEGKNTITTIVFKEKKYHESCFKCQECRKEFKDMKVYCVEENILCQHCYNCRINARAKELAAELK
ncbi:hypothetical protein HDU92_004561 [Lobulomyces angularis]|nr:hypothetical protein HDU92_004561 [Lobulomyces angularis]